MADERLTDVAMTDEQFLECRERAARCFEQTANLAGVFNARASASAVPTTHNPVVSNMFSTESSTADTDSFSPATPSPG